MLTPEMSGSRKGNVIVDASDRGLVLQIDSRPEAAPWTAVVGISAGRALLDRSSGIWILVLAVEIELGDAVRLFIVGEVEPAWLPLTTILHTALPEIEPFSTWGVRLAENSAPLELYQRGSDHGQG